MNAIELYTADGQLANVARCGKCGRLWDIEFAPIEGGVHGDRRWTTEERYAYAKDYAERCCNWTCDRCGERAFSEFQRICRSCLTDWQREDSLRKEAEAFAKAKAVPDCQVIDDDRVYDSVEDYLETNGYDENTPEYLWCARPMPLKLDADWIVETATDELHESAREQIDDDDVAELQQLLNQWAGKFRVVSYEEDRTRYVLVPKEGDA